MIAIVAYTGKGSIGAWVAWVESNRVKIGVLDFAHTVPFRVYRAIFEALAVVVEGDLELEV